MIPLLLGLALAWPGAGDDPVTYAKDIAPILWKNCAECHRPGQVGPFSLLTYQDAAKRGASSRMSSRVVRCRPGRRSPVSVGSTTSVVSPTRRSPS